MGHLLWCGATEQTTSKNFLTATEAQKHWLVQEGRAVVVQKFFRGRENVKKEYRKQNLNAKGWMGESANAG